LLTRQPALKPCPIVLGLEGAFGQFGDPLHLFTERPASARVGRQIGDGLDRAKHRPTGDFLQDRVAFSVVRIRHYCSSAGKALGGGQRDATHVMCGEQKSVFLSGK
jgi:hypothetical protein